MKRTITAAVLVTLVMAGGLVAQQQRKQQDIDLQAAIRTETVDGDLKLAIKQYQAVVDKYKTSDRAVAAKALVRMAESYQKLGSSEATRIYEQLVKEYADQPEALASARAQLAARGSSSSDHLGVRLISPHYSSADTITPDGQFMTMTDWNTGDLVIREVTTGRERRPVTGNMSGRESKWAEEPVLSKDMRQVAYSWFDDANSNVNQLRLLSLESGAAPRILVSRYPEFRNFNVAAWSPDGQSILVTVMKPMPDRAIQLAWVSVADGSIRVLKTFDQWRNGGEYRNSMGRVSLSPDGRFIAYSARVREAAAERYIYVLAADGSSEAPLSQTAGISSEPIWTPDGTHLLFTSDWSGQFSLWATPVRNGRADGPPEQIKADMGRISPIGVTHSGSLYYNYVYGGGEQTFIGRLAPEGYTANPAALISSSFMGGFASWSPDGRSVAFIRHRKVGGTDVYDLVVRSMATGEERVYRHSSGTVRAQSPTWFHSGASLLVLAPRPAATTANSNIFNIVDVKTGQFTEIFSPRSDRYQGSPVAAISTDDRTLYMPADDLATDGVVFNHIIARGLTTKQERLVFTLPWTGDALSIAQGVGLALSPDGRTLAVVGRADRLGTNGYASNDTRLFTVGVDGSKYRDRAGPYPNNTVAKIAWSKDGSTIFFVQSKPSRIAAGGGDWQLMRVPASGGAPVFTGFGLEELRNESKDSRFARLTNAALHTVSFGPDGSQFLLSTLLNPIYEVWALDNVLRALKTIDRRSPASRATIRHEHPRSPLRGLSGAAPCWTVVLRATVEP